MALGSLDGRLFEHARAAGLFPEAGTALLAVSGGPDSLALLDLMHRVAPQLSLVLAVAHVDHGILAESGIVARQVEEIAGRYGLPAYVERVTLGPGSSETRARRARYAALRAVQRRLGARYLVTAHHADDQIETVLYRLLKGSGVSGLAGIRAAGPKGLVRPLLPFRRRELEEWLAGRYPVHRDPANADLRHERSWIRVRLLPALHERFSERLDQNLLDLAAHAASERDAWAALLRTLPGLDLRPLPEGVELALPPLLALEPPLAQAVLRALAREAGCVLGPRRSARVLRLLREAQSGRRLELGAGFTLEVAFGRLRLARVPGGSAHQPAAWGDGAEGRLSWGRWEIRWRTEPAGRPGRGGWETWVERGPGVVRALVAGDRLVPLGGTGRRAVSRLLMEARVPRSARSGYPVVCRRGAVLWVPGVCRGQLEVPALGTLAVRLEARRLDGAVGATQAGG